MKKVEAYGCDYCSMVSLYKKSVVRHEKEHCRKSPDRVACSLCENLYIDDEDGPQCEFFDVHPFGANENIECKEFVSKIKKPR